MVADYLIVDDLENYNADEPIWEPWPDGLGYGTPDSKTYINIGPTRFDRV
jgi:hypothetical protein